MEQVTSGDKDLRELLMFHFILFNLFEHFTMSMESFGNKKKK